MKGTVIYHAPVGDLQVDWEDGAITALKRAGADVKEAGAPNGLTDTLTWVLGAAALVLAALGLLLASRSFRRLKELHL